MRSVNLTHFIEKNTFQNSDIKYYLFIDVPFSPTGTNKSSTSMLFIKIGAIIHTNTGLKEKKWFCVSDIFVKYILIYLFSKHATTFQKLCNLLTE